MIEGAAILLTGMGIGRVWPERRRRKVKDVKPICGCKHHASYHDPLTGACTSNDPSVLTGYDQRDNPVYEIRQCGCRKYTGPEPLPEYYAPEIGGTR